jgi:hypothetical protein
MRALHFRRDPARETGKAEGPHPEGASGCEARPRGAARENEPERKRAEFAKERRKGRRKKMKNRLAAVSDLRRNWVIGLPYGVVGIQSGDGWWEG